MITQQKFNEMANGYSFIEIERTRSTNKNRETTVYELYTDGVNVMFKHTDTVHMIKVLNNPYCGCMYKFSNA